MTSTALVLDLLPRHFAVARMEPDSPLPAWATRSAALSVVARTAAELSLLTEEHLVPAGVRAERGYRALRVRGPLPFHLVGIMASLAEPLARAGIAIFPVATYDTDYLLVKESDLPAARVALEAAGHVILEAAR